MHRYDTDVYFLIIFESSMCTRISCMNNKKIFQDLSVLQGVTLMSIVFIVCIQVYILFLNYSKHRTTLRTGLEQVLIESVSNYRDQVLKNANAKAEISIQFDNNGSNQKNTDQLVQSAYNELLTHFPLQQYVLDSIVSSQLFKYNYDINHAVILKSTDSLTKSPYAEHTAWKTFDDNSQIRLAFELPLKWLFQKMLTFLVLSGVLLLIVVGSLIYQLRVLALQKKVELARKDFVDSMTHELRHPLQGALSMVELLNNDTYSSDPLRRSSAWSRVRHNLSSLDTMIDAIAQRSFSEEMQAEPNYAVRRIRQDIMYTISTFQHTVDKTIQFSTTFNLPEEALWRYDPIHLPNAIKNIIDNAIKYSEDPVQIYITVYITDEVLNIQIKDDGWGISPVDQKHIFDKFYRSKDHHRKHGYGLGLSYVHWVCRLHGGSISLQSSSDQGSEFLMLIPQNK